MPDAPAELGEILDARRGPLERPNRSEIFGPERFAQHGRSLAETHAAAFARKRSSAFFPRLRENIRILREAQHYIARYATSGYEVSPAAEWLLDNFHLIEAQAREIKDGLPRRYFRDLPVLKDEPLVGLPRVYGVAWAFVAHTDSAFDDDLLVHFLRAYEEIRELTLGELWALPTTLRVVLLENLRRLAERVGGQQGGARDRQPVLRPDRGLRPRAARRHPRAPQPARRRRVVPGADGAAAAGPPHAGQRALLRVARSASRRTSPRSRRACPRRRPPTT